MFFRSILLVVFFQLIIVGFVHSQSSVTYTLPVPIEIPLTEDEMDEEFILEFLAYPVAIPYSSILTLAGKKVLSLPILMEDENIPIVTDPKLILPNNWKDREYIKGLGRQSIWFMEKNNEMLYSILLDLNNFDDNVGIGIGYLSVKRLSDKIYDWILRGTNDEILYAVRGEKIILNRSIGQSTFYSLKDQSEIKRTYNFLWEELLPEQFVMFTQ